MEEEVPRTTLFTHVKVFRSESRSLFMSGRKADKTQESSSDATENKYSCSLPSKVVGLGRCRATLFTLLNEQAVARVCAASSRVQRRQRTISRVRYSHLKP